MMLRKLLGATLVTFACGAATACAPEDSDAGGETIPADVTAIDNTIVKEQTVGNCWLYGTAGWAEGLHRTATRETIDLSEAYWTYWDWYEEIVGGPLALELTTKSELEEGGHWGMAAELIRKYGWMEENAFITDEAPATVPRGQRQEVALKRINESLKTGALSTAAARQDPITVLVELNRAWELSGSVVDEILTTFGPERRDFSTKPRAIPTGRLHAPEELVVLAPDGVHQSNLLEAVGELHPGTKAYEGLRDGDLAWSSVPFASDDTAPGKARRSAIIRNTQDTINHRLPVPLSWLVARGVEEGSYRSRSDSARTVVGGHLSLITDYEVTNVPGFGTLAAGQRVTNKQALAASLAEETTVTFFRVKNSWGTSPVWTAEELRQHGVSEDRIKPEGIPKPNYLPQKPGYNDLYLDYLEVIYRAPGHRFLLNVVLPNQHRFPIPTN